MENSDHHGDGRVLEPVFHSKQISQSDINKSIDFHESHCGFILNKVDERLRKLEGRFMLLTGAMTGGGFLGGATGAAIVKILGG